MSQQRKAGNNDQEPKLCIKRSADGHMEVPGLTRCSIDTNNRYVVVVQYTHIYYLCLSAAYETSTPHVHILPLTSHEI